MSSTVDSFLAHLAAVLSLPELHLNDDSVCCLHTPGELEIQMEWVSEGGQSTALSSTAPPSELPCGWSNCATSRLSNNPSNKTLCRVLSSLMQRSSTLIIRSSRNGGLPCVGLLYNYLRE